MATTRAMTAASAPEESLETVVKYGRRLIDIRRHIGLNDYWLRGVCNPADRSLFWFRHAYAETEIVRVPWDGSRWVESEAEYLAPYGCRSCWQPTFNQHHGSLFVIADEHNNECLNVYRFTPGDDGLKQVSSLGYLAAYAFSPVSQRLLIVGRNAHRGVDACLYEMDVDAPESLQVLHCDVPKHRIEVFQAPVIDEDDRRIALTMLNDHHLSDVALGIYRRDNGRLDVIQPTTEPRARLKPLAWRGDELLLISDHEGSREEIWVYDDTCGTMSRLFENPRSTADGLYDADTNRLLLHLEDKAGSELVIVDAQSGTIIRSERVDGCEYVWSGMSSAMGDGEWFVSARTSAIRTIGSVASLNDDSESIVRTGFEPEIVRTLESTCEMHDVSYTTFDLGEDGKPREISGVLFLPKQMPTSPERQAAIIYAHGGPASQTTKSWSPDIEFLCGLGYIVFGPNPRGSNGKGKTFEQLNDQDWGGADFRDYCQGLLYLLRKFGISARRVGMLGGSYGGYMTNWALTRPNTPFAFGISLYGISDLLLTVRESAIAGMTLAEMGDPDSAEDVMQKYVERSPITWAAHLASPMLLIHGSRDNRTVTDQSRLFHKRLQSLGKDTTYLEVDGEGHGFKTVRARVDSMQSMADFLWRVAPVLSEEELERADMLEYLRDELLEVVRGALEAAVNPTEEGEAEVQRLFDQTRQRIWAHARELRGTDTSTETSS